MRGLGITTILPGFQGNVPAGLSRVFPHANISKGWLDALDPLFVSALTTRLVLVIAHVGVVEPPLGMRTAVVTCPIIGRITDAAFSSRHRRATFLTRT